MLSILNRNLLFFLIILVSAPFAHAEEKLYGLAMNGDAWHNQSSQHYEYVSPNAPKGGVLKQAAIGTFDTINPFSIKGKAAEGLELAYDKLMTRNWNEPFSLYPLIAESVEIPEDRSSLTIHLNPKAKFNDSTPITADDVLFSFNTLKEYGRPNMRRVYRQVENIEKRSDLSIHMTFGPDANRETPMILAMMPVLSEDWWANRNFEETLLTPPNSSGPYIISDIEPGRKITYKRSPDYWAKDLLGAKGLYNFEDVTYEYFRDDSVALEAFLKGDLNFRREWNAKKWSELYTPQNVEKIEFKHGRPQRVRAMIFNLRRHPFDNLIIRRALYYAFDGEWVSQNILKGQLKRINSYFPNSVLSAEVPIPGQDLTRRERLRFAKKLLQEAGWQIENNILKKNGEPFQFEIIITKPEDEKIVLAFADSLKRLGIQVNIRTLDSAAFQNRLLDYDYDMIIHRWQNSLSPGTEQMVYWGCDAAKQQGRFNYSGICDLDIDELAESIANAKTYEELTELTQALDERLVKNVISIPLYYSDVDRIAIQKDTLSLPEIVPLYGPVVESWWYSDKTQELTQ